MNELMFIPIHIYERYQFMEQKQGYQLMNVMLIEYGDSIIFWTYTPPLSSVTHLNTPWRISDHRYVDLLTAMVEYHAIMIFGAYTSPL